MTDDETDEEEDELTARDVPHYGSCPACGYVLDDSLDDARMVVPDDEDVLQVVYFDCPDCSRPLRLTVESALPDAVGVDMSLEVDRARLDEQGDG